METQGGQADSFVRESQNVKYQETQACLFCVHAFGGVASALPKFDDVNPDQ